MNSSDPRQVNQIAFRHLKPTIDQTYRHGRYVAINNGKIIADAADLQVLIGSLTAAGLDPRQVLVVQAGGYYPEYVDILL